MRGVEDRILFLYNSNIFSTKCVNDTINELSKIRKRPIKLDGPSKSNVVKEWIYNSWNNDKKGIIIEKFVKEATKKERKTNTNNEVTLILVDFPLYSEGAYKEKQVLATTAFKNPKEKYVFFSYAGIENEMQAKHILSHELGHAFGAPNISRERIHIYGGEHCLNKKCTMSQGTSYKNLEMHIKSLDKNSKYCEECKKDIEKYNFEY